MEDRWDPAARYLKRHLIAYIGNKRSLQPFLGNLFRELTERQGTRPGVFLDAFAGSGAVSRLARTLGFEVHANDWEPYAHVVNRAFLEATPRSLERAFASRGGIDAVVDELNASKSPREPYFSRWYAPENTENADYRTERLFYTQENAQFLDAVRETIERWYPANPDSPMPYEKAVLLALLVYEASVHSNTSGVFKAYHKGFGGHGKDALSRILAPMHLEAPELWDSPRVGSASSTDAHAFFQGRSGDIAYLDPPYNQHQYGSNYHILNSLVLWDKLEFPHTTGKDGRLSNKAGIRSDWEKTRSPFCQRGKVSGAFTQLLDAIDTRWVVVSYNTEGILPFEELFDLMQSHGRVELRIHDYVTYRGGRQSPSRKAHNHELALILDRRSPHSSSERARVRRVLLQKKIATLVRSSFHPDRLRENFPTDSASISYRGRSFSTVDDYTIESDVDTLDWSIEELEEFSFRLDRAACSSHWEEANVLFRLLEIGTPVRSAAYQRRLLKVLRKFTFAKYEREIREAMDRAKALSRDRNLLFLGRGLVELEALMQMRLEG